MAAELILVVEDDPDVATLVRFHLEKEGYRTALNASGDRFVAQVEELQPALVVLDIMLPAGSGLLLLRQLRQHPRFAQLPVIVLTALAEEGDRVRGLDLGAGDYVTKPFGARELMARVRARLRESPAPLEALVAGALRLDLRRHKAQLGQQELGLSDTEFRMLAFLMKHPGRALTRREILDAVWSPQHFITERTVDVYMRRLRTKIEPAGGPRFISAVRQVGYRFDAEAAASPPAAVPAPSPAEKG